VPPYRVSTAEFSWHHGMGTGKASFASVIIVSRMACTSAEAPSTCMHACMHDPSCRDIDAVA
jgi:hypothetical protein